jgi:O-antigen/teichoic acid export membrane protein
MGERVAHFEANNAMSIRKNTLWNLLGSVAPILIGIAALPYIYNQIGIERIGILTIIWALIGYFSIFDFGLGRAITQRIASLSSLHTESQIIKTATTGVLLTLIIGFFGGLVGLATIEVAGVSWINSSKNLEQEIYASFFLACLAIPATTTTAGLRGILEGEQRFKAINLLKMVLGLSNFLSPIASIELFGPRLDYIVGSLVLARYIILGAHFFIVRKKIGHSREIIDIEESQQLFKFGGWMTLSNIISPLMVVADRFLISNVLGAAVVAYYTIPAEFVIKLLVLPAAITTTLFPVFTKDLSEKNYKNSFALYKKSLKAIFLMMGAIISCVLIGADFGFRLWLGPVFAEKSTPVAMVLAVGILFNSLAQVPHAYIQASGDARSTALIHVFESALYLPTLLVLMQMHGIVGAAFAWMLRALLDLVLLHVRAMRINR